MNLSRQFRRLLFAQLLLGTLAYCMAARNPVLLLAVGTLTALSWYVSEGPAARPFSRFLTNVAAAAAALLLLIELYAFHPQVLRPVAHFVLALQIVLLYTRKTRREHGQLMALSVVLVVGSSLLVESALWFALLLAVYGALALYTLMLFQLTASADRVEEGNRAAAPQGAGVPRPQAFVGRAYRAHFRSMAFGVAAGTLLVSVPTFFLLPRRPGAETPMGVLGAGRGKAGFATNVQLRGPAPTLGDASPALTLSMRRDGELVRKGDAVWLLRGAVLDQYTPGQGKWTRSMGGAEKTRTLDLPSGGRPLRPVGKRAPFQARVTLMETRDQLLFSFLPLTHLRSAHLSRIRYSERDGRVQVKDPLTGPVVYYFGTRMRPELVSKLNAVDDARRAKRGPASGDDEVVSARLKRWPVRADEVQGLAREVLRRAGVARDPQAPPGAEDRAVAAALARFLRSRFRYTQENASAAASEADPVVRFLLKRRAGHCELFASGFAAMARTVGLPARVVTGYRVSERNPWGDYYTVRQGHAHAWAEVYLGARGWVPVDPSPAAPVESENNLVTGALGWFRQVYEYFEFAWTRGFVSYNAKFRREMMEEAEQDARNIGRVGWMREKWRDLKAFVRRMEFGPVSLVLIGAPGLSIVLGIASLLRILAVRQRRLAALRLTQLPAGQRRQLARQLRFYLVMLDILERAGHVRPSWQSPYGFAQALHEQDPECFEPVLALTDHFYEIRFGYRDLGASRRKLIQAHLARLEENLTERAKGGPDLHALYPA